MLMAIAVLWPVLIPSAFGLPAAAGGVAGRLLPRVSGKIGCYLGLLMGIFNIPLTWFTLMEGAKCCGFNAGVIWYGVGMAATSAAMALIMGLVSWRRSRVDSPAA